jgi:hypothetical protein
VTDPPATELSTTLTGSPRLGVAALRFFTALGAALLALGALFVFAPDLAEQSYGVSVQQDGAVLHRAIASREVFLGALLLALAWRHRVRELAVVTLLSALVALSDFWNVAGAPGAGPARALPHLAGFVLLTVVGARLWRTTRSPARSSAARA